MFASARIASLGLLCFPLLGVTAACGLTSQDDGGVGSGGEANGAGAGGAPGSGGVSPSGGADPGTCNVADPEGFDCPDYCTAMQQGTCETASGYDLVGVNSCSTGPGAITSVTWSTSSFQKSCFYSWGSLIGARATLPNDASPPSSCDSSSDEATWGTQPAGCTDLAPSACDDLSPGEGGAPPEAPVAQCYISFTGSCGTCCPSEPIDCSDNPDGHGGCVSQGCGCSCSGGTFVCAC